VTEEEATPKADATSADGTETEHVAETRPRGFSDEASVWPGARREQAGGL
jgi:hypothetical protein